MSKRNAVVIYFDCPDGVEPEKICDWIRYMITTSERPKIGDVWKGRFYEANFHIGMINPRGEHG